MSWFARQVGLFGGQQAPPRHCQLCSVQEAERWADHPSGVGHICGECHRRAVALYTALGQTWTPAPWGGRSADAVADDLYAWCLDAEISDEDRATLAAWPAPDLRLVIGWLAKGWPRSWSDWLGEQRVVMGIWPEEEQRPWLRRAGELLDLVDRGLRGEL